MTPRERFIAALERRPIVGSVPTFELAFFLTMEKFGKVHHRHRNYAQWDQMTNQEKEAHRKDIASLYIAIAEAYRHDAIFVYPNPDRPEEIIRLLQIIRDLSGDKYFLLLHGDPTFGISDGRSMMDFAYRLADDPDGLKAESQAEVEAAMRWAENLHQYHVLDGFIMTSDYCDNRGPFISPDMFSEFVAPYLAKIIGSYREMGFYAIKHTDGNIMPILDQLAQTNPHALHSLDPQAGVDIAEVKSLYGDKLCLIGNVNCALLQTGTDKQIIESARYALRHGMPGYGYIFSTSNCVYTGMKLDKYELILDVLDKEGIYRD